MLHDPIHKLLCSYPRVIADILRGYVRGKLVERLDLSTLEQVGTEHVGDGLQRRISDAVWRVRRDDRRWVWVYLVPEFQARPDPGMSLRMLVYVVCSTWTCSASWAPGSWCRRGWDACSTTARTTGWNGWRRGRGSIWS